MLSSVIYARDQIDTNAADGLVQMEVGAIRVEVL